MVQSVAVERDQIFSLDSQASVKAARIVGENLRDYREQLLLYGLASKRVKFIGGNFYYSGRAFDEFSGGWRFITLLREPVAKWFSHFFYNKYNTTDHFRIVDSIEAYLASDSAKHHASNYVTSFTEGISYEEALTDR